jgi:hypothetical protein
MGFAAKLWRYVKGETGIEHAGDVGLYMSVAPEEVEFAYTPATLESRAFRHINMGEYCGSYVSGDYTVTGDNGGAITHGAGGLVLTTGGAGDNDTSRVHVRTRAMTLLDVYYGNIMVAADDADKTSLMFGHVTSNLAEAVDATDGVYFAKAKTAATVVGRIIEPGGGAVDTGTLATMTDAAVFQMGYRFWMTADTLVGANGYWTVRNLSTNKLTRTGFTDAQKAALYAMYHTTPPTFAAFLGTRTGEAGAHTLTVQACRQGVLRAS